MADPGVTAIPTQLTIFRRLAGRGTFRLALEASERARSLALRQLAMASPDATPRELILRLMRQSFRPDEMPSGLR